MKIKYEIFCTILKLWDIETHKSIGTFHDHNGVLNTVQFSPDGSCVAAGSADRTIKMWDVRSQKLLQHYPAHVCFHFII
eukprot:GSMAST32.ASY1.ANO1.2105.1 assembled CDS